MNNLQKYNVPTHASASSELDNTIYEPYAGCMYGLVSKILHDPATVEETFTEVINFISGQSGTYDARRYSLLNWVMNITRVIALKNFHTLRNHNVDYAHFTNLQILKSAVAYMHYDDGLSGTLISDKLSLPLAYVQLLLKTNKD